MKEIFKYEKINIEEITRNEESLLEKQIYEIQVWIEQLEGIGDRNL